MQETDISHFSARLDLRRWAVQLVAVRLVFGILYLAMNSKRDKI